MTPWRIPGDAWLNPEWNAHMDEVLAAVKAELECDEGDEASGEVA